MLMYKYSNMLTKRSDIVEHIDVNSTQTSIRVRVDVMYRQLTTTDLSFLDGFTSYINETVGAK